MFNIQALIESKSTEQDGMPLVMGILNVTPDSFSDGGRFVERAHIEKQALDMVNAGVDIIDIGGESTRPGAEVVTLQEELDRTMPVIEWVSERFEAPVSIDTYKTEVMAEAVSKGAQFINDVNALQSEGAVELAVETGVSVCLMHKQGAFATMQEAPVYADVLQEVSSFLLARAEVCEVVGLPSSHIVLDPGFGFGKTLAHNTALFERLDELTSLKYPLLVGVSRKRMIADILDNAPVNERMVGSVAAAVLASLKGARIVRVHDVKETVEALKVTMQLM